MENRTYARPPSRLSAVIIILGAVFGLVFSTAALVLLWTTRETVTADIEAMAALTGRTLDASYETVRVADRTLEQASQELELIETLTDNLGQVLDNSSDLISDTAGLIGTDMVGFVDNTQTALASVERSSGLIDDFLGVVSAVPFIGGRYRPEVPLQESVQRVSRSLDPLPEAFEQIRRDLDTASANAATLRGQVSALADQVGAIQTSLDDARSIVMEYQEILSDAQARFERFEARLPARINMVYWAATALLVWVLISQLGALLHGIALLR